MTTIRRPENKFRGRGLPPSCGRGSADWRPWLVAAVAVFCFLAASASPGAALFAATDAAGAVADRVAALGLGFGRYVLGVPLTPEQWDSAQQKLFATSYPGTVRFPAGDGELVVVAEDAPPHRVLAIYQRREDADRSALRRTVSSLMDRFGEPTTVAHDRMIYWAYDNAGKISQERLEAVRRGDATISVLATVKLHTDLPLGGQQPATGPEKETSDKAQSGAVYFILSSPVLSGQMVRR